MKNNRLLLELEQAIRRINQEVINPEIAELTINDLCPVLKMVARARADYLKKLFDLAGVNKNGALSSGQINELRELRITYDECVAGAQALETAIQREYLDVKQNQ